MSMTKYEAAAFFAHSRLQTGAQYLVLDLEDCSFGYCHCSKDHSVQLVNRGSAAHADLWESLISTVKMLAGSSAPSNVEMEVEQQLDDSNHAFSNYILSERSVDSAAFMFGSVKISCSDLENALSDVRRMIEELFVSITAGIGQEAVEQCDIILLGRAQQMYLYEYYVREQLSPEPLLPNARLLNPLLKVPYDQIVQQGMALYSEKTMIQDSFSIQVYDGHTQQFTELLALTRGQERSILANPSYAGPLMLAEGDTITVFKNGRKESVSLPYSFAPASTELVDLCFTEQEGQIVLGIRRIRTPDKMYTVTL